MKNESHAWISIGCPEGENRHSSFRIEDGRYICSYCEKDFTLDLRKIYEAGKEQFEDK